MIKFIKHNYSYFIAFIIIFILIYFIGSCNNFGDPFICYAFSHAIVRGEIPYLDFNTIVTPLYAFLSAIGLLIYDNFNVFLLEHSILVTITFILLHKLYGNKVYLLFLFTILTIVANIIATYNYLCFFIMIVIIYLEKKYPNKDYLIGFIIGLSVLSKQTVGIFLVIPTIIFFLSNSCVKLYD